MSLLVGDGVSVGRGDTVGLEVALAVGGRDVPVAAGKVGVSLETGEAEGEGLAVADAKGVPVSFSAAGVLVDGALDKEGVTAATDLGEGVGIGVRLFPANDVDAGVSVWFWTPMGVEDLMGCGVTVVSGSVVPEAEGGDKVRATGVLGSVEVDDTVGVTRLIAVAEAPPKNKVIAHPETAMINNNAKPARASGNHRVWDVAE